MALSIAAAVGGPQVGLTQTRAVAAPAVAPGADVYWVQIGAFRDPQTAARVAQQLREQKYRVQQSATTREALGPERAPARPGAVAGDGRDRYEVVVAGGRAGEVEALLATKGLTSRTAAEGAAITPSLPLGEAVALSKDLASDGLDVRVRRADTAATAGPRARGRAEGEALHRVRVGGFADRAAAEAAINDLRSRGYEPVLVRGSE